MKCPFCDAWSRVLETRGTRRTRECGNTHRFNTLELLVSKAALMARAMEKGKRNPVLQKMRDRQIHEAIKAGSSTAEVARKFGVSRWTVRRVRIQQRGQGVHKPKEK